MGNPKTSFLRMEYMGQGVRMEAEIPGYSSIHPTCGRLSSDSGLPGTLAFRWKQRPNLVPGSPSPPNAMHECSQNRHYPEHSPRGTSCDRMRHIPKSSLGGKQHSVSTESLLRADLDVQIPRESSSLPPPFLQGSAIHHLTFLHKWIREQ